MEQRRNYTHVFNAIFRITKEEGVITLWRVSATTLRSGAFKTVLKLQLVTFVSQWFPHVSYNETLILDKESSLFPLLKTIFLSGCI